MISAATFQEVDSVFHRKKFDRYVTIEERELFLNMLAVTALVIDINETVQVCRDSKDDKFLDVAVNGAADALITGDPDLLTLHPFRGVPVVTPDTFLVQHGLS